MIELRTLGAIDLRDSDGRELTSILSHPKWVALLIYLEAAKPHGFHRRDRLIALLWPELDQAHSRNALSKAVHHLRRTLGDDAIVTRGDEMMIDPHLIDSDIRSLGEAFDRNDNLRALELYRGSLGDGFFVDDAPEFERWLDAERDRIRNAVAHAAWSEADKAMASKRFADATSLAKKAMALNPEDEPSLRRLMVFLDSAGDRAGALRAYEDFSEWLSTELDASPAPETRALHQRIREADTPHFVESLPEPDSPGLPVAVGTPRTRPRRISWLGVAAITAVLLVTGFAAARRSAPKPSIEEALDPKRVIVVPFENRTGNAKYDAVGAMAADWISQNVAATGLVSVVDPRTYSQASVRESAMQSDSVARLRTLSTATRSALVVSGAFYNEGGSLRFQGQLSNVAKGTIARVFLPVSAPLDSPTTAFDSVALQAASAVAEATDSRLEALSRTSRTPPSIDAYREYVQGVDAFGMHDEQRAFRHFMRAYELDTTFTTALLNAGASLLSFRGVNDSVMDVLQKKRASLTPFNQRWLDAYAAGRAGDWATMYRLTDDLARQAPGSYFPYIHASGAITLNRPHAALDALLHIDPESDWMRNWFDYWYLRCAARHMLGDYQGELADSKIGEKQYPANFAVLSCRVRALAAMGRGNEIDRVLDAAAGMAAQSSWELGSPYSAAAAEAELHGYPSIAAKARKRTVEWVRSVPPRGAEGETRLFSPSWFLYQVGAWTDLENRIRQNRHQAPDHPQWLIYAGLVAAHKGDRIVAMAADTALQRLALVSRKSGKPWLPPEVSMYTRAQIAALLGDNDRAMELLSNAFAHQFRYNIYVHADPAFASLRKDPRYIRLMAPRD